MSDTVETLHYISRLGNALRSFSGTEGSRHKMYFMEYLLCVMSLVPKYCGSSCLLTFDSFLLSVNTFSIWTSALFSDANVDF